MTYEIVEIKHPKRRKGNQSTQGIDLHTIKHILCNACYSVLYITAYIGIAYIGYMLLMQ